MFHISAAGMLFREPTFFLSRYLLRQSIHRQKQLQSEERKPVHFASESIPGKADAASNDQSTSVSDNIARSTEIHNCEPSKSNITSCVPGGASTSSVREVSGDVRVNTSTTAFGYETATLEETGVNTHETVVMAVIVTTSNGNGEEETPSVAKSHNVNDVTTTAGKETGVNTHETVVMAVIVTTSNGNGEEETPSVAKSHNVNDVTTTAGKEVQAQKASIQWNLLKNPLLYIYALTLPISDGSYETCLMMIYPHATDIGIYKFKAVFLLSLMGICGGVSRLFTGWFADLNFVKKKHIYQTATLANGILFCLFPFAKRYVGLAVMSGLCGVFAGSIVVLAPVLLAEELGLVNMPVTSSVMYWLVVCDYLCPLCLNRILWHNLHWGRAMYGGGAISNKYVLSLCL